MASKKYSSIERNNCVACGTCMMACPKKAINIVKGCYASVDYDACVGCGKCVNVCPTGCITLVERGAKE